MGRPDPFRPGDWPDWRPPTRPGRPWPDDAGSRYQRYGRWGDNVWVNNTYYNDNTTRNHYYFGPSWSGANYGNWYRGNSQSDFWSGFATGVSSGWRTGAWLNPNYIYVRGNYLPRTWNVPIYGTWGLGTVASSWLYAGYANPYVTSANHAAVLRFPVSVNGRRSSGRDATAQPVVVHDYAKPIDTTQPPPERNQAESAQKIFEVARDRFRVGQYAQALNLVDQALVQLPNDPVLHEFRALSLFALARYEEAAAVAFAVLSAGPGWNWTTMIELYDGLETYTDQLRALEAYLERNPNDASANFLLGYHYLVQDYQDAAADRFAKAAELRPDDSLSAKLAEALAPPATPLPPEPGLVADDPEQVGDSGDQLNRAEEDGLEVPLPSQVVGSWMAEPSTDASIQLTLTADGAFSWAVTEANRTQTILGQARFADDVLMLEQSEGPPLAGEITFSGTGSFLFKPTGAPANVAGLAFSRQGP